MPKMRFQEYKEKRSQIRHSTLSVQRLQAPVSISAQTRQEASGAFYLVRLGEANRRATCGA